MRAILFAALLALSALPLPSAAALDCGTPAPSTAWATCMAGHGDDAVEYCSFRLAFCVSQVICVVYVPKVCVLPYQILP